MISSAQAGVATTTSSITPVPLTGQQQNVYQHVQFVNLSTADGYGSIDGGQTWVYIPSGKGASNTIDTAGIRSMQCVIQRFPGGTDITVFVSAF